MNPVQVDVFFPMPEGWGMCNSCELIMAYANPDQAPYARGLDEYPSDWQADFHHLSDVVMNLSERYQDSILIRIWDPRSLQGLWKSIRHGVRRYPAFVIDGRSKVTGWDTDHLEQVIQVAGAVPQT